MKYRYPSCWNGYALKDCLDHFQKVFDWMPFVTKYVEAELHLLYSSFPTAFLAVIVLKINEPSKTYLYISKAIFHGLSDVPH